jgi:prepilin-type N-terminal cleavage/methylation domain-containing protein
MRRPAFTLLEIVMTLAVIAIVTAVAMPPLSATLDRARLAAARRDVMSTFAAARLRALLRGRSVRIALDPDIDRLRLEGADTRIVRDLDAAYGVTLECARDSVIFGANGMTIGAANMRIVLRRGPLTDTLWLSRLGRLR